MAYLQTTRFGLVPVPVDDPLREFFPQWDLIWRHPESQALALKHPVDGYWRVATRNEAGCLVIEGDAFSSSLRGAARRIARLTGAETEVA